MIIIGVDFHPEFPQTRFEVEIKSLTPQQVETAIKKFIIPGNLVVVGAGDFAKAGS